jgi:AP-3 complex subunit delta
MYGYEFSWASFQVIEVMSASTLKEKTIGYLAASLSFKPDTDVLMLTTNLIKKVCSPKVWLIAGPRFN